jgi:aldose 1-epimerase
MYELRKTAFGAYTRYDLYHSATGNSFSIVPERGANVLNIVFGNKNILDGFNTPEELEAAKWGKSALLFPFPNRLDKGRYEWLGKKYQFPLNNAATENAIHGFVRDESFQVEYLFLAKDHASILCSYAYGGDRDYYPFPFSMEVEFMIHDNGTFTLDLAVHNLHDEAIPVGFGWHPYFKLGDRADQHRMKLPPCEQVMINDRMIPTGERSVFLGFQKKTTVADTFLDNCFYNTRPSGTARMLLEGTEGAIEVSAPIRQFPFFQVFTPPHRESIAVEPMTCNVDAFNNGQGLVSLEPDAEWKGRMEIKIKE